MPIVLTKKKASAKPAFETTTPHDLANLMDEVGAAQAAVDAKAAQIKQLQLECKAHAEKAKQLADLVSQYAADKGISPDHEFLEHSAGFVLQVGRSGNVRSVADLELAMKRLGKKVFFEKATIGLGVLDNYLTPEEKVGVIKTERTVRSIKLTRRPGADAG